VKVAVPPSATVCDGGAIVPAGVPTLEVTVWMISSSTTIISTGTITRLVPLPGPGSGSLLITQSRALYVPAARPVASNDTASVVFVPAPLLPVVWLTASHGTSAGLLQSASPSMMKGRPCGVNVPPSSSAAQPVEVYCQALPVVVCPTIETGVTHGPEESVPAACQSSQ